MSGSFATFLLAIAISLLVLWLALVVALLIWRPRVGFREAASILPDLLLMLGGIAQDPAVGWNVRIRVWLLLGYLAIPFDLVPDVLPLIGWADDAILVALVVRSVVRRSGEEALRQHWPGPADGLAVVTRLAGVHPKRPG
jgi:uncharacterized membrane protein YkvA (DUF1232 family)